LQPNGPFPQTNLEVLNEWVEKGFVPETLRATYLAGEEKGAKAEICAWPLRPVWRGGEAEMECVFEQESFDTWVGEFGAWKVPLW
jgi:tannase